MWIIVLVMFQGADYKIASDQRLYMSEKACKQAQVQLVSRLEATKPEQGRVLAKCVKMGQETYI
tara:strand:+ start:666 stop:857 length:192 start_codon:yes stop_codon:yes gene_type:complete